MNDTWGPDEQRFIAQAKEVLDRTSNELDAETGVRLQRARLAAIERASGRRRWLMWWGGAAIAVSLAAIAWMLAMKPAADRHAAVSLEDFELVTSVGNVELAEDLDFYLWLPDDDTKG